MYIAYITDAYCVYSRNILFLSLLHTVFIAALYCRLAFYGSRIIISLIAISARLQSAKWHFADKGVKRRILSDKFSA